jgi:hypothetical protein
MEQKPEKIHPDRWLEDLPLQTKSEAFQPEEMIACGRCGRKNPPNRLDCMYCGIELEFDKTQSQFLKPVLRKAEPHTNGFNLIYLANLENWDERQLTEVARMTRLAADELQQLAAARKPLPLARAESEKETNIVAARLRELGIETLILDDEKFDADNLPHRLRGIDFEADTVHFKLFNNDEVVSYQRGELILLVIGGVFEKQLESLESRRKKGENKVLETSELSSDEILIDIYGHNDPHGFRIFPKGFDFSCLGAGKKMLAGENIRILTGKLKEFANEARIDEDYLKLRASLSKVWDVSEANYSKGLKRQSFGNYNRRIVTTTSNLNQFTKYSRLQRILQDLAS